MERATRWTIPTLIGSLALTAAGVLSQDRFLQNEFHFHTKAKDTVTWRDSQCRLDLLKMADAQKIGIGGAADIKADTNKDACLVTTHNGKTFEWSWSQAAKLAVARENKAQDAAIANGQLAAGEATKTYYQLPKIPDNLVRSLDR